MRADIIATLGAEPPNPSWLVPDLLTEGSMMILAGDPGVGKTVFSYSLAMALAAGIDFIGRRVRQTQVLYFDEENSDQDFRSYLDAVWRGMDCPNPSALAPQLHIERFSLAPLNTPYDEMMRLVDELQPGLVVIDTATPICRIQDENSNAEASRAIRQLRLIKAKGPACCTFLILKHARVDSDTGKRDIRGAKAWKGELDGVLFHTRTPGRPPANAKCPKGWTRTAIHAGKVRAFGLKDEVLLTPVTHNGGVKFVATKK